MARSLTRRCAASGIVLLAFFASTCSDATSPGFPGTVSGIVLDENQNGVEGASVSLSRDGSSARTETTAADGTFRFTDVPVGPWSALVQPAAELVLADGQTNPRAIEVRSGSTTLVTFRVRYLTGALSGTVEDDRGVGVVGATLTLTREGFPDRSALSAGDGSYAFEAVAAGDWTLSITPPPSAGVPSGEAAERGVTIEVGGTATEAFRLDRVPTGLAPGWELLAGSPDAFPQARHEDVFFLDLNHGWLVTISGLIHRTLDGGASWQLVDDTPDRGYRSVGFASADVGWVGNINFFSAPQPDRSLFETRDGGLSWTNITSRVSGPEPVGVCGIYVVDPQTIYAVGRWQGPAVFVRSRDGGATWQSFDMGPELTGVIDVYFFDRDRGIIVGGRGVGPTIAQQESSVTVILGTEDGGDTWSVLYEGTTAGEWAWKISFPTPQIGYVATQGPATSGVVLKTVDGGATWQERVVGEGLSFSGIGFVAPDTGWVGALFSTWQTTDGGATWSEVVLDDYLNRFRILDSTLGFAVGRRVYRYTGR